MAWEAPRQSLRDVGAGVNPAPATASSPATIAAFTPATVDDEEDVVMVADGDNEEVVLVAEEDEGDEELSPPPPSPSPESPSSPPPPPPLLRRGRGRPRGRLRSRNQTNPNTNIEVWSGCSRCFWRAVTNRQLWPCPPKVVKKCGYCSATNRKHHCVEIPAGAEQQTQLVWSLILRWARGEQDEALDLKIKDEFRKWKQLIGLTRSKKSLGGENLVGLGAAPESTSSITSSSTTPSTTLDDIASLLRQQTELLQHLLNHLKA